jgi:putative transposase
MLIAYKYRLYPTEEQIPFLNKSMGCARFIYNWALAKRKTAYETQKANGIEKPKTQSIYDISKDLTALKKTEEYKWLNEVGSLTLLHALRNLDAAYTNFFRRVKQGTQAPGFPKFKSHVGTQSFQFHQAYSVDFEKQTVSILKLKNIPVRFHRTFEGKLKTATISREPSGRFFISILVDTTKSLPDIPNEITKVIGIDHGIRNFVTMSTGKTWDNIKAEEKEAKHLSRQARKLSRKVPKSKNQQKQRLKKARLEARIADKRDGYIHSVTSEIISYLKENQYNMIAVRKYNIPKMIKKIEPAIDETTSKYKNNGRERQKSFNRKVKDVAWGKFSSMLSYKCLKNEIRFVEVDSAFTSTTCSHCGHNAKENANKDKFICQACGHEEHIDLNAAKNTAQLGLIKLNEQLGKV